MFYKNLFSNLFFSLANLICLLIYFSAAKESAKEMASKNKVDSDDDDSTKGNIFYSNIVI